MVQDVQYFHGHNFLLAFGRFFVLQCQKTKGKGQLVKRKDKLESYRVPAALTETVLDSTLVLAYVLLVWGVGAIF